MNPDQLGDRLARLTFLCARLGEATREMVVSADTLEQLLSEAEGLCRDLRAELKRQTRRQQFGFVERRSGGERRGSAASDDKK